MDKFAGLRAFVAVVEQGSFAAAARELSLSRSRTNKLVAMLEEDVATQLFNRSTRSVAPTSEGQSFYERARKILDDLADAELALKQATKTAVGRLRVSTPVTLGALNFSILMAKFMAQHPSLTVEIVQTTRLVDPITEGFDCVIRIARPDEETHLVDHRIAPVIYVTCASAGYLEKAGRPGNPRELKDHALLHYPGTYHAKNWRYEGPQGPVVVPITKPALLANNLEAIREATCEGLGISILPRYAIQPEIDQGQLVELFPDYELPKFMLQLIYPPSRHLSAKILLLRDFMETCFVDPDLSSARLAKYGPAED
jgi:DNA-binding transcriptional LysR family regulator